MKSGNFLKLDGSKLRVGIVMSRWNLEITESLLRGCKQGLRTCGVKSKNIFLQEVPGSFELLFGARTLIRSGKVDVVVVLGCLILGETAHFEVIAQAVANGVAELNVDEDVPVVFGVLTCLDEMQARVRSRGKNNHGVSWGMTAVEMGLLTVAK